MQDKEYITILRQSLEKKEKILLMIIEKNKEQRIILTDKTQPPERLEENLTEKGNLIERLDQLDEGFEQVYNRVRDILHEGKEDYKEEIKRMQELIRSITDKSATIQTQEFRNKDLAEAKFASVRKEIRQVRTSNKIASQYYKNMTNTNAVDAQFLDSKK